MPRSLTLRLGPRLCSTSHEPCCGNLSSSRAGLARRGAVGERFFVFNLAPHVPEIEHNFCSKYQISFLLTSVVLCSSPSLLVLRLTSLLLPSTFMVGGAAFSHLFLEWLLAFTFLGSCRFHRLLLWWCSLLLPWKRCCVLPPPCGQCCSSFVLILRGAALSLVRCVVLLSPSFSAVVLLCLHLLQRSAAHIPWCRSPLPLGGAALLPPLEWCWLPSSSSGGAAVPVASFWMVPLSLLLVVGGAACLLLLWVVLSVSCPSGWCCFPSSLLFFAVQSLTSLWVMLPCSPPVRVVLLSSSFFLGGGFALCQLPWR